MVTVNQFEGTAADVAVLLSYADVGFVIDVIPVFVHVLGAYRVP